MAKISIVGSGSWGTALARALIRNGHHVVLYGRNAELLDDIHRSGYNEMYLPGVKLPDNLALTGSIAEAVHFGTVLVMAVPSHAFRQTLQAVAAVASRPGMHLVSVTKGIETDSLKTMAAVTEEVLAGRAFHFT